MSQQQPTPQYVVFTDADGWQYHHVTGDTTACGISIGDHNHQTFSDPGDVFIECSDCRHRAGVDLTNRELVEWLGEQAGFETDEFQTPGYLTKSQLTQLKTHIESLQASGDE